MPEHVPVEHPAAPVGPPFDPARLRAEVGGDEAVVRDLARLCLEECPRLLATIWRAIDLDDARGLKLAAHALNGSVANFGAAGVCAAAGRLECLGRDGTVAGADEAYRQLDHEIRLIGPLLAELANPAPRGGGES
jgi:HPt (histidine-containing phosphotransfer) domain-containing protein